MKLTTAVLAALTVCGAASAQLPDVAVSQVAGGNDWNYYGTSAGIAAYSVATTSCNVGNVQIDWMDPWDMPVIAQNMFRIVDGHIEQLGYSFLKDSFCAVSEPSCGSCSSTPCDTLGVGCADTYWAGLNDGQSGWAKWGVDANRGEWFSIPPGPSQDNGTIRGRLQVQTSKLGTSGAVYLVEGQYISGHDQQAGLGQNNQSWRYVNTNSVSNPSNVGGMNMYEPGIFAWQDTHSDVRLEEANILDEGGSGIHGFMWVGSRATDLGNGTYRYDYAVQNLTSERSVGSFRVDSTSSMGTVTDEQYFGIDHHSGSPYSDAAWSESQNASSITWATQTFSQNENANAIRWGNLHAFSFVSSAPPQQNGTVTVGIFEPGSPTDLTISAWVPEANGSPPTADFTGSPTSGNAPLSVNFSDSSSGQVSGWAWDFGDGGSSTSQNPSHTYTSSGTYTVSMTASGPGGADTRTRNNYITVNATPPTAEFFGNPTNGNIPLNVSFTNQASGEVNSYSWSFGDGSTSSQANPSHTYTNAGTYNVSLTVSGPGGSDSETKNGYITATVGAPEADFAGFPTVGNTPHTVIFSDLTTGTATSWSWNFGDGGTSSAQNPQHTYNTSGVFNVSLTATGPGGSDTETKNGYITVFSSPPTSNFFGNPTSGSAPLNVAFTNTASGEVSSYNWSFGDGATSSAPNPSHTYTTAGTYNVALTVSGPGGSDTETKNGYITVSSGAPSAAFSGSPTSGNAPLPVFFLDESTGTVTSWAWDFGDGGTSTQANPQYTYTQGGVYTVSLTVTGPGGSDTETLTNYVTVNPGTIGTNYCTPNLPNSTGSPASIVATGSTDVADNDVTLTASDMPLSEFGYFLASPTQGFIPMPGGSAGNFCLGGGGMLGRYNGNVQNSGATGTFSIPIDLNDIPISVAPFSVAIQPGDTWNFQGWHRDGQTSNFTDGVSILFQ
ncbi:MAG: PKD domain-containing protein [bacterium]|nr:PKD domain-containing protein [bacterium]